MEKTGIENIRCFAIAAGVSGEGAVVSESLSCVVSFKSSHDKFHQVYVNGKLSGVTSDAQQRKIIVPLCLFKNRASVVEVVAVEVEEKLTDFSEQITSLPTGRLKVTIPSSVSLPYEGFAEIYSNGGDGEIDFSEPVSKEPIRLFTSRDEKSGFGLSKFGASDFGYDASGCVGFGVGEFGVGEHGFDSNSITWESEELESGKYKFGAKVTDSKGNSVTVSNETEIAIVAQVVPVEALMAESYDKTQNELVLRVS